MLVIQSDGFNASGWLTTVLLPLTSSTSRAHLPGFVFVPATVSGLPLDSTIVATRPVLVPKSELAHAELIGELPGYVMTEVDTALRVALDL